MPLLTKSLFTLYLQNPLELWLKSVRPDLLPPIDPSTERRFAEGRAVDDLSRGLYPGGVTVGDYNEKGFKNTQSAIVSGARILYQPTAVAEGLSARADILVQSQSGAWDIHEVKDTTSVKDEHVPDLAFQRLCFESAGMTIGKTFLTHVNNQYVRQGEIDVHGLFTEEDITEDVQAAMDQVRETIPLAKKVMAWPKELEDVHMRLCVNPKTEYGNVLHWLNNLPAKKRETALSAMNPFKVGGLLEKGEISVDGISQNFLSAIGYKPPAEHWPLSADVEAIKAVLDKLIYPLYFYDYETFASAIPPFDGYHPYQQIPFQFSLAIQKSPGAKITTADFLLTEFRDPVPELIAELKKNTGTQGTFISWNAVFENGRNKEMAAMHPEHADFLLGINKRTYDLMQIFRKKLYVHPEFYGSASLKRVMPVLIPDLSYKNLHIQQGGEASASWLPITDPKTPKKQKDQLIKDEIEYCRLDVLAMVRILGFLRGTSLNNA